VKKPFLLLWGLIIALFVFFWVYLPTLSKYRDLKTRQEEIEAQIETLETKIKEVREERDLLKNDVDYLEKVIRDELGLVKPGEIVYKFVKDKPSSETSVTNASNIIAPETSNLVSSAAVSTPSVTPPAQTETILTPTASQPATKKTVVATPAKTKKAVVKKIAPAKKTTTKAKAKKKTEPVYPRQETR
jgi:cell division protein FtsB